MNISVRNSVVKICISLIYKSEAQREVYLSEVKGRLFVRVFIFSHLIIKDFKDIL